MRSGNEIFFETEAGNFIKADNGKWFVGNEGIFSGAAKRHFILLLREAGRVIRCADPGYGTLLLCCREGLTLTMNRGFVFRDGSSINDIERWRIVKSRERFYKDFVAAMKR